MFVKSLTFLILALFLTGNVRAGVISATWMETGCAGESMSGSDQDSNSAPFDDEQEENKQIMQCPGEQSGLAGGATVAPGVHAGLTAFSGAANQSLADPELRWRLHMDDDSLPCSPVLSGLLKPS